MKSTCLACRLPLFAGLLLEVLPGVGQLVAVVETDMGLGREVVQEGCPFLVEIGQVELEIWKGTCASRDCASASSTLRNSAEWFVASTARMASIALRVPRALLERASARMLSTRCQYGPPSAGSRDRTSGLSRSRHRRTPVYRAEMPGADRCREGRHGGSTVRRLHDAHTGSYPMPVAWRVSSVSDYGPCRNPANGTAESADRRGPTHQGQRRCNDNRHARPGLDGSGDGAVPRGHSPGMRKKSWESTSSRPVCDRLGGPRDALVEQPRGLGERQQALKGFHPQPQDPTRRRFPQPMGRRSPQVLSGRRAGRQRTAWRARHQCKCGLLESSANAIEHLGVGGVSTNPRQQPRSEVGIV